jgi:integron integrase
MTKEHALTQMKRILRMRHYALSTEENYLHWVGRFLDFLRRHRSLPLAPASRMEAFLSAIAQSKSSASTQNQAFNALLFFYRNVLGTDPGKVEALRARRPKFVRHAPTREHVKAMLDEVRDTPVYPYRLIVKLLYGCGLRVSEPLGIRIRDIDLTKARIVIRQAKGGKDRVIPIPPSLIEPIRTQIEAAKAVHDRALIAKIPTKLPHRLANKNPRAARHFGWFWLFPAAFDCADPHDETGDTRVWWHCLDSGVQKAMREACERAKLPVILTPHHLRHAWATHSIDAGASVRDVQEILGHKSLETTMQYVHPEIERVISPLESL